MCVVDTTAGVVVNGTVDSCTEVETPSVVDRDDRTVDDRGEVAATFVDVVVDVNGRTVDDTETDRPEVVTTAVDVPDVVGRRTVDDTETVDDRVEVETSVVDVDGTVDGRTVDDRTVDDTVDTEVETPVVDGTVDGCTEVETRSVVDGTVDGRTVDDRTVDDTVDDRTEVVEAFVDVVDGAAVDVTGSETVDEVVVNRVGGTLSIP